MEDPKGKRQCKDCNFYQSVSEDLENNYGLCKRYAPKPKSGSSDTAYYPTVLEISWCGEFESSKELNPTIGDIVAQLRSIGNAMDRLKKS